MAVLETLLSEIILPLRVAGFVVYGEYELQEEPVPGNPFYLTVAVASAKAGAPVPFRGGTATPMAVTLRFRLHSKLGGQPDVLRARWETSIFPTLLTAGYAMTEIALREIYYDRHLNRNVLEAEVTISALFLHYPYEEDASG